MRREFAYPIEGTRRDLGILLPHREGVSRSECRDGFVVALTSRFAIFLLLFLYLLVSGSPSGDLLRGFGQKHAKREFFGVGAILVPPENEFLLKKGAAVGLVGANTEDLSGILGHVNGHGSYFWRNRFR